MLIQLLLDNLCLFIFLPYLTLTIMPKRSNGINTSTRAPRRGKFLPSLITGPLEPIFTVTLRNVMGGCELFDLDKKNTKTETPLVVDFSMIGVDPFRLSLKFLANRTEENLVSGKNGSFAYQQCLPIVNTDHIVPGSDVDKENNTDNSMIGSQKLTAVVNNISHDTNHEYAKLIDEVINDFMDNTTTIKTEIKEQNNKNHETFELFHLNNQELVNVTPSSESEAPVIISLQNFYESFKASATPAPLEIEPSLLDFSNVLAENNLSPEYTVDTQNEQRQFYNLDSFKIYKNNVYNDNNFSAQEIVQDYENEVYYTVSDNQVHHVHETYTFLDSGDQFNNSEISMSPVTNKDNVDFNATAVTKNVKRKRERAFSHEKNISCSECDKKFRTPAHLKNHFIVHSTDRVVSQCYVCNKTFCHRGALTLHMRAHAVKKRPMDK